MSTHSVLVLSSERERQRVLEDIMLSNPPGARVLVNGRPMLREGALKLIARLPYDSSVRRQLGRIWVDPDPFTGTVVKAGPVVRESIPSSQELVRRLIAAQQRANHGSK